MAFGFNTFSESPFAAIVENPIVAVTGQLSPAPTKYGSLRFSQDSWVHL